jgi:hypothetical protein
MKGTSVDGSVERLFSGKVRSFIKCVNVEYESKREEDFYDIQLDVKGCNSVYDSFKKYTEKEMLDGENQYDAGEEFGKQDAQKGVIFTAFPPVLTIHLKRFDFDLQNMGFTKIHDKFEFPSRLCLDEFLSNDGTEVSNDVSNKYLLHSVLVHSGDVGGGHYYAYIRPSDGYDYAEAAKVNQSIEKSNQNITLESMIEESNNDTINDISSKGKWYKFNDESVIRVRSCEAIENCFGSNPRDRQFTGLGSAYMLVYIRESDASTVMKPLVDDDIPVHLKERLKYEVDVRIQEERRQSREKQYYNLSYYLEEDIADFHSYSSKMDFLNVNYYRSIRVMEGSSMLSILLQLSDLLNISPIRIRIWFLAYNKRNDHLRASYRFEFNQDTIKLTNRKFHNKDSLYIEILPEDIDGKQVFYDNYNKLRLEEREYLKKLHDELIEINGTDVDNNYLEGYGIGSSNIGLEKQILLPVSIASRSNPNEIIQISSENLVASDNIIDDKNSEYNEHFNSLSKQMNDLMIKFQPSLNETFLIFFKVFDPLNKLPLKLWNPLVSIPNESKAVTNEYNPMKYLGSKLLSQEVSQKSLPKIIYKMISKVVSEEQKNEYFKDIGFEYNIMNNPITLNTLEISEDSLLNQDCNVDGEIIIISQILKDDSINFNDYPYVVDSIRIFQLISVESWLWHKIKSRTFMVMPSKQQDINIIKNKLLLSNNKKIKLDNNDQLGYKINDVFDYFTGDNESDISCCFSFAIPIFKEVDKVILKLASFMNVDPKKLLLYLDSNRVHTNINAWHPLIVPARKGGDNLIYDNNILDSAIQRKIKATANVLFYRITPFDIYKSEGEENTLSIFQDRNLNIILVDNYTRNLRRKFISDNYSHNININQVDDDCNTYDSVNDEFKSKKRPNLDNKDIDNKYNEKNANGNKIDINCDYINDAIDNNNIMIKWPVIDKKLPIDFVNEREIFVVCQDWSNKGLLSNHSNAIMSSIGLPINMDKDGHIYDVTDSRSISIYDDNRKNTVDMSKEESIINKVEGEVASNTLLTKEVSNIVNQKQNFRDNILANQDNYDNEDNISSPPAFPYIIYHLNQGGNNYISQVDLRNKHMNNLVVSW